MRLANVQILSPTIADVTEFLSCPSIPHALSPHFNFSYTTLSLELINTPTMPLGKFDGLELPAAADMHVHLRDGAMMETVTPTIRQGGVNTVYVMVWESSIVLSSFELTFLLLCCSLTSFRRSPPSTLPSPTAPACKPSSRTSPSSPRSTCTRTSRRKPLSRPRKPASPA